MSEPIPEYDLGQPEQYRAFVRDEPGLPDELVQQIAAEPAPVVGFNSQLIWELSPVVAAVLVTVCFVEVAKGLGIRKMLKRKFRYSEEDRTIAYKWLTFLMAIPAALSWGFRETALDLMSVQLSWAETIIYGGLVVATGARLVYEWRITQVIKLRVYRFFGYHPDKTLDELDAYESGPTDDEP